MNGIRARRTEGVNPFVSEEEMKLTYATDDVNSLKESFDENHDHPQRGSRRVARPREWDKIIQLLRAML
jgi:hypothetical protein